MTKTIDITDELYERLARLAKGFDTPADVIGRLLESTNNVTTPASGSGKKDTTKYIFDGDKYGKGKLVLAVIKKYYDKNRNLSIDDLMKAFPSHLQGSMGVFSKYEDARKIFSETGHKRHFIDADELINTADGRYAVCSQWGKGNINAFIDAARKLNFKITPTDI